MKNYLINFTNRVAPKNKLQRDLVEILSKYHRSVLREIHREQFFETLRSEVAWAEKANPRCRPLNHSTYEHEGDQYFDVAPPCESTLCRLELLAFEF